MLNPLPVLEDLIRINSVNPLLVPQAPGERELAQYVKSWCETHGLEVQWLEAESRPSLIIKTRGDFKGKTLMLNAHLDTVGTGGMSDPFTPRYEANRLYGRGAVDMKAGLSACMVVMAEAQRSGFGKVVLTAVADEESDSLGTAQVLEHVSADAAIVTEPTQLRLHVAHRGFAVFEVETLGKASHTSQPEKGINAISAMGTLLAQIQKQQQVLHAKLPHPLLGHGLLQPVLIHGGQELFTTPAKATLHLERRSLPGETLEILEQEVRNLLQNATSQHEVFKASFKTLLHREPFEVSPEEDIVQVLHKVIKARGLDTRLEGAPYWMDAALIAAKGIPTVVFGPSGGGMHATDEWVDIESVQVCAEVLLDAVKAFCL